MSCKVLTEAASRLASRQSQSPARDTYLVRVDFGDGGTGGDPTGDETGLKGNKLGSSCAEIIDIQGVLIKFITCYSYDSEWSGVANEAVIYDAPANVPPEGTNLITPQPFAYASFTPVEKLNYTENVSDATNEVRIAFNMQVQNTAGIREDVRQSSIFATVEFANALAARFRGMPEGGTARQFLSELNNVVSWDTVNIMPATTEREGLFRFAFTSDTTSRDRAVSPFYLYTSLRRIGVL